MSVITGFCMFFLSFFPLWISVLFIDIKSILEGNPNIWTEIISISLILLVSIISLVVLMHELNPRNTSNQQEYRIVSAKETSLDKGTQRKTTENELPSLTQCTA